MQLLIAVAVFMLKIVASDAKECDDGYWGENCMNLCGKCITKTCKDDGVCTKVGCHPGWFGNGCETPICKDDMCGGGQCVAPGVCVCTELWSKDSNNGCYSLRVSGLKGAAIAIVVLIISILGCQGGYKFAHNSSSN